MSLELLKKVFNRAREEWLRGATTAAIHEKQANSKEMLALVNPTAVTAGRASGSEVRHHPVSDPAFGHSVWALLWGEKGPRE